MDEKLDPKKKKKKVKRADGSWGFVDDDDSLIDVVEDRSLIGSVIDAVGDFVGDIDFDDD
jgi:hypothetical protein